MADPGRRPAFALLSSSWGMRHAEGAFVDRALVGGLSRLGDVDVLTPGAAGGPRPDGAFDVTPVGTSEDPDDPWSHSRVAPLPRARRYDLAIVDRLTPGAASLVGGLLPGVPVVAIGGGLSPSADPGVPILDVGMRGMPTAAAGEPGAAAHQVGCHVAVNPLAGTRRHAGIGFTGYLLVLTDRGDEVSPTDPPALARWLIARFPRRVAIVIDNGIASVWRARSFLGAITVDTRTDLWRLLAHAAVTVDLKPGPYLARECVESLRFGVPIIVPSGTVARRLAAAGGGLWYADVAELFACVEALDQSHVRSALAQQGREAADAWYGDPSAFVGRLRQFVTDLAGQAGSHEPAPTPHGHSNAPS